MSKEVSFVFNGNKIKMVVEDHWTLLHLIREELGYTGTKEGCGSGECGACTVIVDGDAVNSCLYLAAEIDGKDLQSIEGLASDDGALHPAGRLFEEADEDTLRAVDRWVVRHALQWRSVSTASWPVVRFPSSS